MNRSTTPVQRAHVTPFGAGANKPRCPLCGSQALLPLAPTAAGDAGSYCAHCPWDSRNKALGGLAMPRVIGSQCPAPIRAEPHLQRRQADRARWQPIEPTRRSDHEQARLTRWERLQVAGAVVLGIACLIVAGLWAFAR